MAENRERMETTKQYVDEAYPPTMTFDVDTLEPTKVLKQRVDLIRRHFPTFFKGNSFKGGYRLLDVGCSKGFFSLSSAEAFYEVEAIDHDEESIGICKDLNKYENVTFHQQSFREFISTTQYDRIFLGNVAHHLFMEIESWDWIKKLYALSCGHVLIEGALSTECKDMDEYIPDDLHSKFNKFLKIIEQYFHLLRIVPTVKYTPDRYLMLLSKKQPRIYALAQLPCVRVIREKDFKTFITRIGFMKLRKAIAKVRIIKQPIWADMNRIRIAACSPVSNGLIAEILDRGIYVGWLEAYSRNRKYRYFENEKEIFKLVCKHNIYLSQLGYVDLDPATINFFKGSNKLFDKSCVFPISHLRPESADAFPLLFNQSYRQIPHQVGLDVAAAIKTHDPARVEYVFREALKKWT